MRTYENDDDLERALFALDLEEPPADLRASILAATIYRPPLPIKIWEIWTLGLVCAVLTWLLVLIARGSAAPLWSQIEMHGQPVLAAFLQPSVLFWIALGGGAALWISQLNLTLAPGVHRTIRR